MLSPALMQTLLHFYYRDDALPHVDSSVAQDHVIRLMALKLLCPLAASRLPSTMPYELTPLGKAWVRAILATPKPKYVEAFVDTRTGKVIE
jgi:hypothetical protein